MAVNKEYFIPIHIITCEFDWDIPLEQREWLNRNIGRQHWQLHGPGSHHPNSIRFETEEDALAFTLCFLTI